MTAAADCTNDVPTSTWSAAAGPNVVAKGPPMLMPAQFEMFVSGPKSI